MSEFPGYACAGIIAPERMGYSVQENAARLHRLAYVERQLLNIAAGHLLHTPELEIKYLLGRTMYEDSEHHDLLRTRITELRRSEASVDQVPGSGLAILMDQVLRAGNTLELLAGLYLVIKPALLAAYQNHLEHITPLVDYPTGRALRLIIPEEQEHIDLGRQSLDALISLGDRDQVGRWERHLRAYLAAAGGIDGDGARLPESSLPAPRGDGQAWQIDLTPGRDARFQASIPKDPCVAVPDRGDPTAEGLEQMMWVRFNELSPAEGVAVVIFMEKDRPWPFYHDLARHCWDELRHAAFGQTALQAEGIDVASHPSWTGWTEMAFEQFTPMEAYTHLTVAIEQAAMKYPPGKRQEYEFCRDKARHARMALYQDYDWADEVNHAQFGQRWVVKELYKGDRRAAIAAGDETVRRRAAYFSRYAVDGYVPDPYARRAQGANVTETPTE